MNNKGASLMSLPVNLLMLFIAITFLIALIPGFAEMQSTAQQSDNLNCKGYVHLTDPTLSYNATTAAGGHTSTISCMAIKLYLPYIVLGVLISAVAMIFYGQSGMGGGTQPAGY